MIDQIPVTFGDLDDPVEALHMRFDPDSSPDLNHPELPGLNTSDAHEGDAEGEENERGGEGENYGGDEDQVGVEELGQAEAGDEYEDEDGDEIEEEAEEGGDRAEGGESAPSLEPVAAGLKEISNLGRFTISSFKPGNGIEELRSDDLKQFWQSDGPQPHRLTIHFVKRVGIRDIRFYVDFHEDESYTPTKIIFKSGTSENGLIDFATMDLKCPVGWQQVPVAGAGGGPDGNTLFSHVLQILVTENHQNGKDTHLRGIRIYALDPELGASLRAETAGGRSEDNRRQPASVSSLLDHVDRQMSSISWSTADSESGIPDFMREPELR